MKKNFGKFVLVFCLVCVLAIGFAFAEMKYDLIPHDDAVATSDVTEVDGTVIIETDDESGDIEVVEDVFTDEPETKDGKPEDSEINSLKSAFEAYFNAQKEAKEGSFMEKLKAELQEYLDSGKMTQEEVDTLLNYYKELEARKNHECPNCGYKFSDDWFACENGKCNSVGSLRGGLNGLYNGFNNRFLPKNSFADDIQGMFDKFEEESHKSMMDMFGEFVDKFNDVKPEDDKNGLNDDMYEEEFENGNFKLKQYRDENGNVYGYSMQWHN